MSAVSSSALFPRDKDTFHYQYTKPSKNRVKRCLQKTGSPKNPDPQGFQALISKYIDGYQQVLNTKSVPNIQ